MAEPRKLERLTTGVRGLDLVLGGGLYATAVYLLEGGAGSGKTILANQLCFHHAASGRRAVYYTLLSEEHDRMMRFLRGLRFFDPALVPERLSYASGFKVLEAEGLNGLLRGVREAIAGRKATLLAIDGLATAEEIAANDTVFKKFIHELQAVAALYGCTIVLLVNTEAAKKLQCEHTVVDGILRLDARVVKLKPQRSIEVLKLRGSDHLRGTHTVDITDDGLAVYPRIETRLSAREQPAPRPSERRAFHVPALDRMLGGGVPSGSNTMLLGASGTGKTMLGLQFVAAGLARGEKALFFTFYEQERELLAKAQRLGLEVGGAVERGELAIVWQSSVEASVDKIGALLLAAFDRLRPARIFIDGIHGFQVTAGPQERIQDFFAALGDYFVSQGATLMFTAETQDLMGGPLRVPFPNASRMAHNIVLLRFAEVRARLTKILAILKLRDSNFDPSLRELIISDRGIELGERPEVADALLGGQARHDRER